MRRFLTTIVAVALMTAGCSEAGSEPVASGLVGALDRGSTEVGEANDGVDALAMVSAGPFAERLRLALVKPRSYRPDEISLTDQSAVIIADLLYDGLTEAVGTAGVLRPGLASEWWADGDFTTWTFRLDPEAAITPSMVVDSLAPLMAGHGGGRAPATAVLAAGLQSVEATGDRTVTIELDAPNAGLPWVLSGLPFSIVGVDGRTTGYYEVASDDTNGLVLNHRTVKAGAGEARPAEVLVTWAADPAEASAHRVAGRVDAAVGLEGSGSSTTATRFYVLNDRPEALADPVDRLAVLAAIDRDPLVRSGFTQPVQVIDGLVAPGLAGYRPGACDAACGPGGQPDGAPSVGDRRVQISYAGAEQRATAAAIVEQLATAGFDAEESELAPDDLAGVIVRGETDMFAFGWVAPATSSDAVLPPLLSVDSPANIAMIDAPEVSILLAQAAVTADDGARWAILDAAQRAALAEALILPVAASASVLSWADPGASLAVRADGSIDVESPG